MIDRERELNRLDSRIAELKIEIERSGTAVQAAFMRQRTNAAKPANDAREADQPLQKLEREAVAKRSSYTLLRRRQEMRNQQTPAPDAYVLSHATRP